MTGEIESVVLVCLHRSLAWQWLRGRSSNNTSYLVHEHIKGAGMPVSCIWHSV